MPRWVELAHPFKLTIESHPIFQVPGAKSASSTVGDGFYTYPCNSKLGSISLVIDGASYAVNPADFNLGAVSQ